MHEGFDITFREVIPESAIIELVIEQLASLHGVADLHCSVVLRRSARPGLLDDEFDAHIEFDRERHGSTLQGDARGHDPYEALSRAFAELREQQLMH